MNRISLLLLCIFFLTPGVMAQGVVALDRIVAIVDDDIIVESELRQRVREIADQLRRQGSDLPPAELVRRQMLERMILERIQIERARQRGIQVDDESLNQVLGNLAQQNNLTLAEFRTVLERDGYDFNAFREQIRQEILTSQLRQREVESSIHVTEREIANHLAARDSASPDSRAEYRLRHILIALPEGSTAAQQRQLRQRADEVLRELQRGADFAATATAISDGGQAVEGGDLGWRDSSRLPTLFAELVSQMEPGSLSEVIETPGGYHIIQLVDRRSDRSVHHITQTRARHILISTNEMVDNQQAQDRLMQLRQRILQGEDFATLARANSDDRGSAVDGGELSWLSPGDVVPPFEQAMDRLAAGEISEPFQSQFGWHIVQVLERRQHDDSSSVQRAQARDAIFQRKLEEETERWLRRLRDEAFVEIRLDER